MDDSGRVTVRISPHVTVSRPPLFPGIEPGIIERSCHYEPDPIVTKRPRAGLHTRVEGILREVIRSRNPFRVFDHARGTIGSAMLGRLARQPVGQITVHAARPGAEQFESYTTWIPTNLLREIERGHVLVPDLEAIAIGKELIWFCNSVGRVG